MHNWFPRFFLTILIVQNVPLRMTDMATGCHLTPNGFPCKSARMHNQKLRNIRPSGDFWPQMTSRDQNVPLRMTDMATGCDVTPKGFSCKNVCMCNWKLRNIRPSGAFWSEMTSCYPVGLTLEHMQMRDQKCLRVLSRMSASNWSFSSPFTGYLPISPPFYLHLQ